MNKFKLSVFIVSSIYLLTSFSPAVKAQEAVSLVISPPRTDISVKPGETIQKNIKITNNSQEQELILKVSVKDFIVQDDLGTPIPVSPDLAGKYIASPWMSPEKDELVIPPKTTDQLVVIITIPADALPGGHYAGVFFEPIPSKNAKNTVSYTSSQVGSLFALTIPGDIKYDAIIKQFTTKLNVFEFGPIEFSTTIENQSDTHITPTSSITIHDMVGRKLAELPQESINIFPYTSRSISSNWDNVWGFGRYTATFSTTYGPGLVATRDLSFWIMPYRLIASILIVIIVIVALAIVIRRHVKHQQDHRDEEIDDLKRKILEMENRQN